MIIKYRDYLEGKVPFCPEYVFEIWYKFPYRDNVIDHPPRINWQKVHVFVKATSEKDALEHRDVGLNSNMELAKRCLYMSDPSGLKIDNFFLSNLEIKIMRFEPAPKG